MQRPLAARLPAASPERPPWTWTPAPWVFALGAAGLALFAGVTTVERPLLAVGAALGVFALGVALALRAELPRLALGVLGGVLLGYALLGRGFAYVGAAPLYVGELTLVLVLGAALLMTRPRTLARLPLAWLLGGLLLVGLVTTLPHVGTYGLDALRDAVLWGYGLFALAVAALLLRAGGVLDAARAYARCVPVFLWCAPVVIVAGEVAAAALPRFPGAAAPLGELKGGDVAVHLAGIAALLLLGLPRLLASGRAALLPHAAWARREWVWWALWLAAAAIPVFRVRAGLLSIVVAVLVVVLLRPGSRWGKPAALTTLALAGLLTLGGGITLGERRNTISAEALVQNLQSISGQSDDSYRNGTRSWRLNWWGDIARYTFTGPYFWTGKGYGINLADADGYQLGYAAGEARLRSPHNGHLTLLARSGVPGLVAWTLLNLTFALGLLRAYFRARAARRELWARLNLWTLAYWAAFMTNASFDVYLEGPTGGIPFWCLFGFGIALLAVQRRSPPIVSPPLPPRGAA
ncbi:O-antigen ligase family protein [Deinococcus sp. YIM 134068]|uniref:O-antigen ligase family protein n=1 Tax=Deinococcus lichenicola TaxID=3118910 RepID=UPI002F94FC13